LLLYCLLLHPAYCLELGTTATASGSGNDLGNKNNCLVHWLNIFLRISIDFDVLIKLSSLYQL
jgi:hypothetical protein